LELDIVQKIAIYALPVIFAITLHEAAHGYVVGISAIPPRICWGE
jgi:hypothetical protein